MLWRSPLRSDSATKTATEERHGLPGPAFAELHDARQQARKTTSRTISG